MIWDKGSAALGRGFRAQHESFLVFTNGTAEHAAQRCAKAAAAAVHLEPGFGAATQQGLAGIDG